MITAAIGLAGGLASGILGASKAAKAAREQQRIIAQQKAKNDAWYNRNYYQNYLDTKEAQSAIKRVEETMRRRNQDAQAQAAITGGTQESVIAQQANDQKLMGDVMEKLASRGDAMKQQVNAQYQAMDNNIMQQQMAQKQANEAGGSDLMNNGLGMIGSALSLLK